MNCSKTRLNNISALSNVPLSLSTIGASRLAKESSNSKRNHQHKNVSTNVPNVVFSLQGTANRFHIAEISFFSFHFSELRPVIVEPWDIRDDEDGLPEKSLVRNPAYVK